MYSTVGLSLRLMQKMRATQRFTVVASLGQCLLPNRMALSRDGKEMEMDINWGVNGPLSYTQSREAHYFLMPQQQGHKRSIFANNPFHSLYERTDCNLFALPVWFSDLRTMIPRLVLGPS